ncbi:hypothetical protein WDU94_007821 [Cyamophila willieti]
MTKDFAGEETFSTGWGLLEDYHIEKKTKYPPILQGLVQKVVDESTCNEAQLFFKKNSEQFLCLGGILGYSPCNGDSGGPLTWTGSFETDISARKYLIGVASHGKDCGTRTVPSYYTRTTFFMKWILDHMRE